MRRLCWLLFLCVVLVACDSNKDNPPAPLAEVDVALPIKKKIIEWDEYTGRFQAIEAVDIRSRVTGYLTAIKFTDGQMVKKRRYIVYYRSPSISICFRANTS